MKRMTALTMAVLMCVSLFAGCGSKTAQEGTSTAESRETAGVETTGSTEGRADEFTYPTSGSLTLWQWANGNVTANFPSFEATPAAGWVEEATGVKVDWIDDHANTDEVFQLMTTDAKLPDMISHSWLTYNGGTTGAYEDGLCIKLNDVIDQYMPHLRAYLDANPEIDKAVKDDKGDYYFIPYINVKTSLFTYGSFVRADMLEELGAEVPTTIEGWHDLLTRVKKEKGITPYTHTWGDFLTKSFVAYAYGVGDGDYSVNDKGEVVYNRTSDNYKAFLTTLNQWYSEGLIDTDIASIAAADSRAKIISGDAFMSAGWLGSNVQLVEQASDEWNILAVATPSVQEGVPATDTYRQTFISGRGVVITPSCENVELAARWMDYFFTEEGILLANFGKEGESYTMVDGVPTFTDEVVNHFPEGWTQFQSLARYSLAINDFNAMLKHEAFYPQTTVEASCKDAIGIWGSVEGGGAKHQFPLVSYTEEEASDYSRYTTDLKTSADEWAMNFIIGAVDMDQWDTYVAELEALGAKEALAINQAAYARYIAR